MTTSAPTKCVDYWIGRAQGIAKELGVNGIETDTTRCDGWAAIKLPSGIVLSLHFDGWNNEDRVRISASWPRNREHQLVMGTDCWIDGRRCGNPSIGCDHRKKSDRQIAQDINRRLLPELRPIWEAVQKKMANENEYHDGRAATIAKLVAAGCSVSQHTGMPYCHAQGLDITSVSNGTVSGRVDLTVDEFIELLKTRPPYD